MNFYYGNPTKCIFNILQIIEKWNPEELFYTMGYHKRGSFLGRNHCIRRFYYI